MRNSSFESDFAGNLREFLEEKRFLGYSCDMAARNPAEFDAYCKSKLPGGTALTKELHLGWTVKRESEKNGSFRKRMSSTSESTKFLIRRGCEAYVPSNGFLPKQDPGHLPHIRAEDESAGL
ncbi:MAG: hypothetical protein LBU32_07995 [Clostridiales bacterium]|jgi:hypothetical protein|nr:hypothetical protein [Clostridiales bacterium]